MHIEIKDAINELVKILKIYSDDDVATFELFVNSEGYETKLGCRDGRDLEENGISMKNLKGEWIKVKITNRA